MTRKDIILLESVYATLPDPATHIRLLEILPRSGKAPLSADFRIAVLTVPFKAAPAYHAIFYTWGDASGEECITVFTGTVDRRITVHKSNVDGLWQLDNLKPAKYYLITGGHATASSYGRPNLQCNREKTVTALIYLTLVR